MNAVANNRFGVAVGQVRVDCDKRTGTYKG